MAKLIGLIACFIGASIADDSTFDPKKSSATDMVIKMLEDAKDKVTTEGAMEKKTFEKFETWCNETKEEKTSDVDSGTTTIAELEASIKTGTSAKETATTERDRKIESIEDSEKELKEKLADQKQGLEDYKSTDSELVAATAALDKAVDEMKAHQTSSAAFIQIKHTVRRAVLLADSLGFKNAQAAANGLNSEEGSYDAIIDTLEGLLTDFRQRKNQADMAQVQATATFKTEIQVLEQTIAAEKKAKSDFEQDIATTTKNLAANNQSLAEAKANLKEDTAYLNETTEICATKMRVYNQRKAMREEEIAAIEEATSIMKGVASKDYDVAEQGSESDATLLLEVAESRLQDPSVLAEAADEAEAIARHRLPLSGVLPCLLEVRGADTVRPYDRATTGVLTDAALTASVQPRDQHP